MNAQEIYTKTQKIIAELTVKIIKENTYELKVRLYGQQQQIETLEELYEEAEDMELNDEFLDTLIEEEIKKHILNKITTKYPVKYYKESYIYISFRNNFIEAKIENLGAQFIE